MSQFEFPKIKPARIGDEVKYAKLLVRNEDITEADVPMIADCNRHYFDEIGTNRVIWFAYSDDVIPMGMVQLISNCEEQDLANGADVAQLHNLLVIPKFRGRRVSSSLNETLESEARSRNVRRLTLEVLANNLHAISIYRHWDYSFFRSGNHLGLDIPGLETIVMAKKLQLQTATL